MCGQHCLCFAYRNLTLSFLVLFETAGCHAAPMAMIRRETKQNKKYSSLRRAFGFHRFSLIHACGIEIASHHVRVGHSKILPSTSSSLILILASRHRKHIDAPYLLDWFLSSSTRYPSSLDVQNFTGQVDVLRKLLPIEPIPACVHQARDLQSRGVVSQRFKWERVCCKCVSSTVV